MNTWCFWFIHVCGWWLGCKVLVDSVEKKLGSDSSCKLKLSIVNGLYQSSVKTKMDKDGIHIGVVTQIASTWNLSRPNGSRFCKLWHFNLHDFFQRKGDSFRVHSYHIPPCRRASGKGSARAMARWRCWAWTDRPGSEGSACDGNPTKRKRWVIQKCWVAL